MIYNGLIGCLVASILGFRFHNQILPLDQLTIRVQLQSSCRDILMRVSYILMRVSECYTFELAIITRSMYKTAALYTNGIISFTSVLKDLSKTVTMVHTSKVYKQASYEEYRDNGMFSSEANCMQFLYDLKILRTNHQCPRCRVSMALQECPATKYREGCCWKCKCGKTIAPRVGSILANSHVTYEEFIKILAYFAEGKSVASAAQHSNLAKDTVRRFYNKIHQRIAEDIITKTKIGGPGTVVEIDESKFGKQKYSYGRMVETGGG